MSSAASAIGSPTLMDHEKEHDDEDIGPQDFSGSTAHSAQSRHKSTRNTKPRRRRHPPARSEADIARDTMIEQIMKESQVPLYDRPYTQLQSAHAISDDQADRDDAAAAAFRAEFLAAAEERNLSRRAPAPPTVGASHGPKLGGSRAQRERMKAAEEAAKGKVGSGGGGK